MVGLCCLALFFFVLDEKSRRIEPQAAPTHSHNEMQAVHYTYPDTSHSLLYFIPAQIYSHDFQMAPTHLHPHNIKCVRAKNNNYLSDLFCGGT